MSTDDVMPSAPEDAELKAPPSAISQIAILGIIVLVGALALTAVILIARDRLQTTVASDGQDMSGASLGLTAEGFRGASMNGPVAEIAASLAMKAATFTPKGFDAEVAAAKKLMSVSEQRQYAQLIAQQNIRALVTGGMTITTSLVHLGGDPKKYAYLGVVSLTQTSGEFVMVLQRTTTLAGSRHAEVTPLLVDVTVAKIGNTWVLSDVEGLLGL